MPTLSDDVRASYYDWSKRGLVYIAYASVTTPVIWSTAAGTGGPLLWNNTTLAAGVKKQVNAVILGVSASLTTATSVASSLGLTGATGQTDAPSTATAIDGVGPGFIGQPAPLCNTYRIGTTANAGTFFFPTHNLGTGAITTQNSSASWVDVGGAIIVPPGSWCSVAAAATATSGVIRIGLMWAEVPV